MTIQTISRNTTPALAEFDCDAAVWLHGIAVISRNEYTPRPYEVFLNSAAEGSVEEVWQTAGSVATLAEALQLARHSVRLSEQDETAIREAL